MDTGDTVRNKATRITYMVACVHGSVVHLAGFPPITMRMDDLELVREATDGERLAHLRAMADSSSSGHRAECARQRLNRISEVTDEYGASFAKYRC